MVCSLLRLALLAIGTCGEAQVPRIPFPIFHPPVLVVSPLERSMVHEAPGGCVLVAARGDPCAPKACSGCGPRYGEMYPARRGPSMEPRGSAEGERRFRLPARRGSLTFHAAPTIKCRVRNRATAAGLHPWRCRSVPEACPRGSRRCRQPHPDRDPSTCPSAFSVCRAVASTVP